MFKSFLKITTYFFWTFRLLYYYFLRAISFCIPKSRGLWLFGSWGGKRFSSSTKYLYLYIQQNCPNIRAIWITKNKNVFKYLTNISLPVCYAWSIKGIFLSLRAEVTLISNEIYDINPGFTDASLMIQLFHHVLPLKYMMRGEGKTNTEVFRSYSVFKKLRILLKYPFTLRKPDYFVSSSDWMAKEVTEPKLWANPKNILITGFPRTDAILKEREPQEFVLLQENLFYKSKIHKTPQIIYYLPTHRDHDVDFNPFHYNFNINKLNRFLEISNSIFVVRFHPRDSQRLSKTFTFNSHRIIKEPEGFQDPYFILRYTSLLITDYGSIFSDFLLLNKPIIFACFDYEKYENIRTFNWDFNKFTPGHKVKCWDQIIDTMSDILIHNNDKFKLEREILKNKIYAYQDTNNSERLVNKINIILSSK
ncbi:CDP-glycerol glycerophosphotransferase family protein [Bacteroidota bacterium]